MINYDDDFVDDRLKNTTRINPTDQFILKHRDCSWWEKQFLRNTEGTTCSLDPRLFLLENLPSKEDIDSFLEDYKLAKAAVENAKKVNISQELQDLKRSPDRTEALKKAIAERVYPPKSDPLMLDPLYRSVTSPDFVNEFEFNGNIAKAVIHYRSEYGCGEVNSSVEEIVEMFESDKKEEENK